DDGAAGTRAQQIPADDIKRDRDREAEEIEPLILVERQHRRVRLIEHDALHAAGQRRDAIIVQELRRRDGEREGRQREIEAFEAQRRQTEEKTDDETERAGDRDCHPIGHANLRDEDRRRIRADREKRTVAERDLTVVADQKIEAEQCDGVDDHHRRLEGVIGAEHKRQREQHNGERREAGGVDLAAAHTRGTTVRPKRPEGLRSSTPTMITSATLSLISVPTTYAPARFSSTPTTKPPITAPSGLVRPPSKAAAKA